MSTIECFLILHIVHALTFFFGEVNKVSSVLANRIKPYPVFLHNYAQPTVKLSMNGTKCLKLFLIGTPFFKGRKDSHFKYMLTKVCKHYKLYFDYLLIRT